MSIASWTVVEIFFRSVKIKIVMQDNIVYRSNEEKLNQLRVFKNEIN